MDPETQARIRLMALQHGLTEEQAIERAVATQWYLDQQLAEGWRIVLFGRGRARKNVVLPVP